MFFKTDGTTVCGCNMNRDSPTPLRTILERSNRMLSVPTRLPRSIGNDYCPLPLHFGRASTMAARRMDYELSLSDMYFTKMDQGNLDRDRERHDHTY